MTSDTLRPKFREHALLILLIALTPIGAVLAVEKSDELHMHWSLNAKTGTWTDDDVRVAFPKSRAGFTRKSAEPFNEDGTAIFQYWSEKGVISLYLGHRLVEGYPGASALRDGYLKNMHQKYGRTDSEISFRLAFQQGSKHGAGVGTTCHFLSFPAMGNKGAYSEIGAVMIDEFLFYYRASFVDKSGLADLSRFLQATGVRRLI
jgi:hypothetical protein